MPKVVTIPVRFVKSVSDTKRRSSAAVTIQRIFRGFVARRSFGVVKRIDREVDAIALTIARDLDLIIVEEMERVRTNELLMAVLLRLDSVRGAREYRRKMIRKVVSLQEFVDSFMAGSIEEGSIENQETLETEEDQEFSASKETLETVHCQETLRNQGGTIEGTLKTTTIRENSHAPDQGGCIGEGSIENQEILEFSASKLEEDRETIEIFDNQEIPYLSVMKEDEETLKMVDCREIPYFTVEETIEDQETLEISGSKREEDRETLENRGRGNQEENSEETLETTAVQKAEMNQEISIQETGVEEVEWSFVESPKEERNSKELGLLSTVERMALENETLKALLAELCERSALQCRLMEGLAERVQQLEKTVQAMKSSNVALAPENK